MQAGFELDPGRQKDERMTETIIDKAKIDIPKIDAAQIDTAKIPPAPPSPAGDGKIEPADAPPPAFDAEAFSHNLAQIMQEGGKALAAYLNPQDASRHADTQSRDIAEIVRALNPIMEYWLSDPKRAAELQAGLGRAYLDLWGHAMLRMTGHDAPAIIPPDPRDKRFKDPEWNSNQFFDFLKQAYLLASKWANDLVENAEGVDEHTRRKAQFYVQQIANAISPSNFVLTNPELLRETFQSSGENLARGMKMLAEDVEAGEGKLLIRQTDRSKFEVGRNLAMTPGKIVFRNELIELIQYNPTTENVLRTPLLIVPPWINKFYILDLNPEKSFIKWCVDQGLTVFVISWVNPDASLKDKTFGDYMKLGPLAAMDAIEQATGEMKIHTMGYCVGGTMLSVTLGWLAAQRRVRVTSATLLASQVDFTYAGDLKIFADEDGIAALEQDMQAHGYLDARKMASTFNALRSNELVWPYVINTYLKGKPPLPFDLLYWNSDSTRMAAANHSFYLRNCYLDNTLAKGEMVVEGETIELGKVKVPIYNLSTRDDHIAPAKSGFHGLRFFGGETRFVLSGSGHIAGVVNPPALGKYQYWTHDGTPLNDYDTWVKDATEHPGSWWPDWLEWLRALDPEEVPARTPGTGALEALGDAPGDYVKVTA